jgi:hypothetical protein
MKATSPQTHVFPPPLERRFTVEGGRVQTRSLEVHVVDHCNLRCEGCCSLSPALPPWFVDVDAFERDLARAARVLAPRVFKLVGGEPLLHPQIVTLAERAKAACIAPRVSLTTNAVLLAKQPDALFAALDAITISLYPEPALAADVIAAVEDRARAFDVALNWKKQDEFVQMDRARVCDDDDENRAVFADCWLRERCHLLRDGLFSTCTRPAHFQTWARDAVDFSSDSLRLTDETAADDVVAYLTREEPLRACSYCHGGSAAMRPHRQLSRDEARGLRIWPFG